MGNISYAWKFLEDLPTTWKELANAQLELIGGVWKKRKKELVDSETLHSFNEKLARRWSIETGIIEGLYRIERGITELLIEKGIEEALIPHGSTDKPAEQIVDVLRDHQNALEGLFYFVKRERKLSISYIRELHQTLCAQQHTVEGRDALGNRVQTKLIKGDWKKTPNNPHRADGTIHQYCPPEHVDSEMQRLVELHEQHMEKGVAPEVEAAWLHHRFTQIHPFQDGNGRVARALASLVLIRGNLFPLVIDRDIQGKYIEALEIADRQDDLKPLVEIIGQQQHNALLGALDSSRDVIRDAEEKSSVTSVILVAADKLRKKEQQQREREFQGVVERANSLIDTCKTRLEILAQEMEEQFSEAPVSPQFTHFQFRVQQSRNDQLHYYRYQIIKEARKLNYFANTDAWHQWVRFVIIPSPAAKIIFSFHQFGKVFTGVFLVTAFYEFGNSKEGDEVQLEPMSLENGFAITLQENHKDMLDRFKAWMEKVLVDGLNRWSEEL